MRSDPPQETAFQRLDKWLWAARFFKTRNSAAAAVAGGRVQVDNQRVKPSRRVRPGSRVQIRRGPMLWDVVIVDLSSQRRPAKEAAMLYRETEASIERRQADALHRKQLADRRVRGDGRPTKRNRRELERLKNRL